MKSLPVGIVGGVGPAAGLDLCRKILSHTKASGDSDHIDLYLASCPSLIPDRTEYLLHGGPDPSPGIFLCMKKLVRMGARILAVACNTAHSKKIIGKIDFSLLGPGVKFVNLIEETCLAVKKMFQQGAKIGLLATPGTLETGVYQEYFEKYPDLTLVRCEKKTEEKVNAAIYDRSFGIKALSPVSDKARRILVQAALELKNKGCQAVVLGCTELPLALTNENSPLKTIDATDILAKAIVREASPEKLI